MENNKYFTPDIEDICIGYEYEQLVTPLSESLSKSEPEWMKCKFPDPFTIDRILLLYERKEQLRVPYLTKEQIESEGWKQRPAEENLFYKGVGRDYDLYIINNNKIRIINNELEDSIYYGECKDINTFRKIIKLLGI